EDCVWWESGAGCAREPLLERIAVPLAAVGQEADDLEPQRVPDRAHDRRQVEGLDGRVRDLLVRACGRHAGDATTSKLPISWKYRRRSCPSRSLPSLRRR